MSCDEMKTNVVWCSGMQLFPWERQWIGEEVGVRAFFGSIVAYRQLQ